MDVDQALADARSRLLHDLGSTTAVTNIHVDALENALTARRAWVEPWPEGVAFLACLVAQDLQESLVDVAGRWPMCRADGSHQLHVEPDLGDDPRWVCQECSIVAGPVGGL
ncbi:MAG: hypothetical protein ABI586_06255 [Candidatus Nanopelagicales bacterium]